MNNTHTRSIWANLFWNRFAHIDKRKVILLWIAFFLFYAATTARDILPADSGEFQLTAAKLGIAHPPGYPLYTMVSALWSHLILLGSVPYRTNLLSATLAATTLVVTYNAVVLWGRKGGLSKQSSNVGAFSAVLLLGAAGTFWAQAVIANIRMPTLLFTAWGFSTLARYSQVTPVSVRDKVLRELALIIGLGTGHHPSLLFVAIGWVVYILLCDVKLLLTPQRWGSVIVIIVCAWGVPQLYLPIRGSMAEVVLNPGNLTTWSGFWGHVLAQGFSGDMFAFVTKTDLLLRLPLLPSLFRFQFPVFCMLIMCVGWIWLIKWQRKLAATCALSWLIHTFVTITYRAPQTIEYLMPAYLPMVIIFGVSVGVLHGSSLLLSKRRFRIALRSIAVLLILLMARLISKSADFSKLAADNHIRARTEPLLTAAPDNSLILADWRWVTPLWGMQSIENQSTAVDIHYVYPEQSKTYDQVWLERVENADTQPVFVTHKYDWQNWNFAPVGGGYRLYRRPLIDLPDNLDYTEQHLNLGSIDLLGYRIIGDVQPGQTLELQLVWQSIQPFDPPPSFTARIWDDEDSLLSAADRFLGDDSAPGEIRFTQLWLQLPFDSCSPDIQVTIGVYTSVENEFINLGTETLTTIPMLCEYPTLPVVRSWLAYIANQGPVVRGIDYDLRTPSTTMVYLHLTGPGTAVDIQSDASLVSVPPLKFGENYTALISVNSTKTQLHFSRPDALDAKYIGLPFPTPKAGERYTPYGDKIVLVSSNLLFQGNQAVLNLKWLSARPINEDYVVSARLRPDDDSWQLRHDIQPGLGAIPTLKWVNFNYLFLDPHPFVDLPTIPDHFDITVYEPFRMTPLLSPYGRIVSYSLP